MTDWLSSLFPNRAYILLIRQARLLLALAIFTNTLAHKTRRTQQFQSLLLHLLPVSQDCDGGVQDDAEAGYDCGGGVAGCIVRLLNLLEPDERDPG